MTTRHTITIGSDTLPIVIRRRAGVRRIIIRYQPLQQCLTLTLPRYVNIRQGLHFVEEKRQWIARQLSAAPAQIPFTDGQAIPVFGTTYTLRHAGGRGVITVEGSDILVHGDPAFMQRRVREWLKAQMRARLTELAQDKARRIGQSVKKISLRDTSSRWGSCSHDGHLSFSWRLVFAPIDVLDYLVAHEVAHLAEHNHSPAFWNVVHQLCPDYERPRRWLKTHGTKLYAYG
jgi:predicted metal-dependent hydrolase